MICLSQKCRSVITNTSLSCKGTESDLELAGDRLREYDGRDGDEEGAEDRGGGRSGGSPNLEVRWMI